MDLAGLRTSDEVVSSKSERGERRDRPLAGCHDRADAADAKGVNLAIPIKRKTTFLGGFLFIPGNSEVKNERRSREFD